jgi:hypothetical protein
MRVRRRPVIEVAKFAKQLNAVESRPRNGANDVRIQLPLDE